MFSYLYKVLVIAVVILSNGYYLNSLELTFMVNFTSEESTWHKISVRKKKLQRSLIGGRIIYLYRKDHTTTTLTKWTYKRTFYTHLENHSVRFVVFPQ